MKFQAFLIFTALFPGTAAIAADAMQLKSEVFQEIESADATGKKEKTLVPVTSVVPGTEVVYVTTYKNNGLKPADKVVINNPIPANLEYKAESAYGSGAAGEVSVNGGKTWGKLAALQIAGADGKPRPAQPADVTHVRWVLGFSVKPGDEGKVTYRARLK